MARLRRAERHPLRAAFGHPAAGGVALMVAAACALVWANSPWRAGYHELLRAPVAVGADRGSRLAQTQSLRPRTTTQETAPGPPTLCARAISGSFTWRSPQSPRSCFTHS